MSKKKYKKGDIVINEGTFGTSAFIIISGRVEVSTLEFGQKKVHSSLGDSQIFGEMSLITDEPRKHTVTALEKTVVEVVKRDEFNDFFSKGNTSILSILAFLLERLRISNKINSFDQTNDLPDENVSQKSSKKLPERAPNNHESQFETAPKIQIVDNRYLILTGLNEISTDALKNDKIKITTFPYKVGRYAPPKKTNIDEKIGDKKEKNIIAENDLYLFEDGPNYYISENHFMLDKIDSVFSITDRGSRLGVIIDDRTVKGSCTLAKENTLIVGSPYSPFLFKIEIKGKIEEKQIQSGGLLQAVSDEMPEFEIFV